MPYNLLKQHIARAFAFTVCTGVSFSTVHHVHVGESIQAAVSSSVDGDTVLLHEGTYEETVILYGKTITLGSLFLLDGDTLHIENTVITPDDAHPDTGSCLVYAYEEQPEGKLIGATLRDGTGTGGQGENRIGGGIFVRSGGVTLEHCVIRECSAVYGGGIALLDIDQEPASTGFLRNCTIRDCEAELYGGGIWAKYCDFEILGSTVENCHSGISGGGIYVSGSQATMDSCFIRGCSSLAGGVNWSSSNGYIQNSVFEYNSASEGGLCSHLNAVGEDTYITRCIFRENRLGYIGVLLYTGSYRDLPHFYGNVVEDNVTTELTGSVALMNADGDFSYNIIRNNTNVTGGAIYVGDGSDVRIHHNWIEGNVSTNDTVGASAILTTNYASPRVEQNVITGNTGVSVSCFEFGSCRPVWAAENWWGHASGPYHATLNPGGQGDTLTGDWVVFEPWLTEIPDTSMSSSVGSLRPESPATWRMLAVYPNPFNSEVRIEIAGFANADFRLTLHDILGRQADVLHAGAFTGSGFTYRAPAHLASGVYFVRASSGSTVESRKVVFLK